MSIQKYTDQWKSRALEKQHTPQIYANDREKQEMKENHAQAIETLRSFINKLHNHKKNRALEVACGSGILARDFLSKLYN